MARMLVVLDGRTESGGSPLLMHNDRLADPLNPFSLEMGKITKKRNKTEADHLEIALIEFMGAMYNDATDDWLMQRPDAPSAAFAQVIGERVDVPYLPGWQVIRTIQEAGKRHKLGRAVIQGVTPVTIKAPVQYEGPSDVEEMWRDGRFALRKSVGVGSSRTMRTRPIFQEWGLEVEVEVDLAILDPEKINQLISEAGRWQGVGDYRAVYGHFKGSAALVSAPAKKAGTAKVSS